MHPEIKNVAFYIGDFTRSGGTERVCTSVVNGLARKGGFRVYLIVTNNQNELPFFFIDAKVKILYLNVSNYKRQYFTLIRRLTNNVNKYKIGTLVAVEVMSLLFILPAYLIGKIRRRKLKLIVWEHFNYTVNLGAKLRNRSRKWAAKYASYIVVLTKRDMLLWDENLKIKNGITVINNLSPFSVSESYYKESATNIIAIGRLSFQKGFDRLIDIWDHYIKMHPEHKEWKLQIVGSGVDRDSLQDRITRKALEGSIEMIGNTSNISDYYENASFLVMTSRFEGLPMTLIEAQTFGLPIIAYDCLTGPSEVITSKSGFLIEDGNQGEFVEKLHTLIANKQLRIDMSKIAKEEVSRFSEEEIINQWHKLINSLL